MSYLESMKKNECTGCSLCAQVCSHKAISMIEDEEGFYYPQVNMDLCVSCGLCIKSCTENIEHRSFNQTIDCFAAICKEKDKLLSSSSGGAFYSIVASCTDDTDIYGAAWKDRSHVEHKKAVPKEAFDLFRKSKYVQSNISDIYCQVKDSLDKGKKVVFVGTPCQIDGIKSYFRIENNNLIFVDLICHGVSSSNILESCLNCFDYYNDKVTKVTFRYKENKKGRWKSKLIKLEYQSGKEKILDYDSCGFLRGYDNGLIFRPSCYNCKYACKDRVSDISIGDFWGGEKYGYDPHRGTSLIIVNSEKGKDLLSKMSSFLELEGIDYQYAVEHNACLRKPSKLNSMRDQVLHRIKEESFEHVIQDIIPRIPKWKKTAHAIKSRIIRRDD